MSRPERKAAPNPLIDRLTTTLGYPQATLANHAELVARPGMNVLFFPGDPASVRDATDVAVVLPELVAAFDGRLAPGVVTDVFGDGDALRQRYGFSEYPALVFVRDGQYIDTLTRIRDWAEYLVRIGALFDAAPKRPPGIGIPIVSA
jgi:hydrogenase-1 operon protein HyaE